MDRYSETRLKPPGLRTFHKAEELVRKLDNSDDFLFDKDIKETLPKLFTEHGSRLIWE